MLRIPSVYGFPGHIIKVFVSDPLQSTWDGGETPWYIYRSAEVYLLLAESNYWKNDLGLATLAINEVRQCAGAAPLTDGDVNIGEIFDERTRELYYEENRHIELVRVAFFYAKKRKPCEIFGGRVYDLNRISVHHILWPVPANAINTNIKGVINQNVGYPGTEKNKTPLLVEDK
ncbi:RagB/SusD family nutrient uptake outer membrane protein [Sphingobacterium sp.]|uniref:RagB/SusD family nutrient uptake outer membrane protein n=1 Tax=Sphingobacterium sp. TaxID=341027 RepID=UPI00289C6B9A|nr:RagB/SusD family nutrient uptake outer membrane protein [Sphingobacterium sp.]